VKDPTARFWFCESGTAKIGRFDPATPRFTEYDFADREATPIALRSAPTARSGSPKRLPTRSATSRSRRDHGIPAADAGRLDRRHDPRYDGNVWFSETEVSQDRPHHAGKAKSPSFPNGITPGCKPLSIRVRDGALWFSERPATASDASRWTAW